MNQRERDYQYIREHYGELVWEYPDRWVAVYQERVVAIAPDDKNLRDDLVRAGYPRDLPVAVVYLLKETPTKSYHRDY